MNQLTLEISTDYQPKPGHVAYLINDFIEAQATNDPYTFGRPKEYNLTAMVKLILLAYSEGIFTSRRIAKFAEENLPARWLTQEQEPSYRTICRARLSDDFQAILLNSQVQFVKVLKQHHLIDEVLYIDGTKILADANKYGFVWKKNVIRFDQMNREHLVQLLGELKSALALQEVPAGSDVTLEQVRELTDQLAIKIQDLDKAIAKDKVSPDSRKKFRRQYKSLYRQLSKRGDKLAEHQVQYQLLGKRNSYAKTDTDATFMRIKEDPMMNGQLKPAYNLQIATSNQFIIETKLFSNPIDTRTLTPFISQLSKRGLLGQTIVADAGYGSEPNYTSLEDNYDEQEVLIPYGTMLKEQSKQWQTNDAKVMNWDYHELEDYYVDPKQVRFNFHRYLQKTDRYGQTRSFKEYRAEGADLNQRSIPEAHTKSGQLRRIQVNPTWEYQKNKMKERLSLPESKRIYAKKRLTSSLSLAE